MQGGSEGTTGRGMPRRRKRHARDVGFLIHFIRKAQLCFHDGSLLLFRSHAGPMCWKICQTRIEQMRKASVG